MSEPLHPRRSPFDSVHTSAHPRVDWGESARHAAPRRLKLWVALLVALPLLVGLGVGLGLKVGPTSAWSSAQDGGQAAPALGSGGIDPQQLVAARRAAGQASTQAGLLTAATGELKSGTDELGSQAGEIISGAKNAAQGARELSDGLVQLQAGTGQLGSGATQVADGIDQVYTQLQGLVALQVQVMGALDNANTELGKLDTEGARQAQQAIEQVKAGLFGGGLNGDAVDQLTKLRDGARDVANQLAVSGYSYHDGVYSATAGAKELADGLAQFESGAGDAEKGITQLTEGVSKVNEMAGKTQEDVKDVVQALPATQASAGTGEQKADQEPVRDFSPVLAFLVVAVVSVAAAGVWAALMLVQRGRPASGGNRVVGWLRLPAVLATVVASVFGVVITYIVRPDRDVAQIAVSVGVVVLAALVAVATTRVVVAVVGARRGVWAAAAGLLAQVAVVGFVWQAATSATVGVVGKVLAGLAPMNYPVAALTAANNAGSVELLTLSAGVCALVVVLGFVLTRKQDGVDANME